MTLAVGDYLQERALVERRQRVYIMLLFLGTVLYYSDLTRYRPIKRLNEWLKQFPPWKLVLGLYTLHQLGQNASLILGLGYVEWPDQHYSNDYRTIRWLFTGLDAGFCSTIKVKNKLLRDFLSIVLSVFYLLNPKTGEDKMNRIKQVATVKEIRTCWEKGRHPLLLAIGRMKDPVVNIHRRKLRTFLREEDRSPITVYLYYNGTDEELAEERKLVIHTPGGGFVAMSPLHHETYINYYCSNIRVPFISIDYRKAPEHPYPAAINDAYDVYREVVRSKGAAVGIKGAENVKICLTGDSAGGNLAVGMVYRALLDDYTDEQRPQGLVIQYPALDFESPMWQLTEARIDQENSRLGAQEWKDSFLGSNFKHDTTSLSSANIVNDSAVALTSRAQYFTDSVLPVRYFTILVRAYLPIGADPNDPLISPMRIPAEYLARFPPTYINCGDVDPLSGDSRRFIRRLKKVNPEIPTQLVMLSGCSHAYMNCPRHMLPQAKEAVELNMRWIAQILDIEPEFLPADSKL